MKKRLVSGIKPTGDIHIGNYFGAMKQFLDLQYKYESFIFVADYHALNQIYDGEKISKNSYEIIKAYLSIGLDPEKVIFFKQSDISIVTELCWILNCFTSLGLLKRAHAYKDAVAKKQPVNMGLFDYPVLMAADILIYKSDIVPVGQDQKQHLEITQEIARIFNKHYGNLFKIPQPFIKKDVAVVPGTDGRKMSKSYNNVIGLFDDEATVKRKVFSIVTDSKGVNEPKNPETCNVFALHKLFSQDIIDDLEKRYRKGNISYQESKEILAENINRFLLPIRQKKKELDQRPDYIDKILKNGAEKAYSIAQETLKEVKKAIGFIK